MTQFLAPSMLAMFAARDPIPYLPPPNKLPHEKKSKGYHGVGAFLDLFEHPSETPPPTRVETREERMERRRRERAEQVAYKLEQEIALWDPANNPAGTGDAFKTLFVSRINYDTSESKLRREFEGYGTIKKIVVIHNSINGKPRGYAFIEYEHERDMHSAYKHADGKKIDGRRVLVDVERARTVKGWLPRRLGGGLGGTRRGGPDVNIKHSGREDNERERERYRLEREREERGGGDVRRGGDRERERPPIRRRTRSRSPRPRRRKSRSRSGSRPRHRRREERAAGAEGEEEAAGRKERKERKKRSRSRDRERDDRKRDRDRDRDRKRDRKDRRDRDDKRDVRVKEETVVKVKEEPVDDYPDYNAQYNDAYNAMNTKVKQESEQDDEKKFRPDNSNGRGGDYENHEDGEYEGDDY